MTMDQANGGEAVHADGTMGPIAPTYVTAEAEQRLLESLHSTEPVRELTHNFYRYPARMSSKLPRDVIKEFTKPGDTVLDPFMGGGTSVVEALAANRNAIGVDVNPLAVFIASVKTTPLPPDEQQAVRHWVQGLDLSVVPELPAVEDEPRLKNLPASIAPIFANLLEGVRLLPRSRQRRFARCVLLRTGQWAIDCKTSFPAWAVDVMTGLPSGEAIKQMLLLQVESMLARLNEFMATAGDQGSRVHDIASRNKLLLRSSVGLHDEQLLSDAHGKVKLVVTSPPYPGIHVLYHRWQVHGRRETPAPYWLIGAWDGRGASYYTMGSRTPFGLESYFRTISDVYRSVRPLLRRDALVVQLIAFSDVAVQLPAFLAAMEAAGYGEAALLAADRERLWRSVPNRKWYNQLDRERSPTRELLLFHRPRAQE